MLPECGIRGRRFESSRVLDTSRLGLVAVAKLAKASDS